MITTASLALAFVTATAHSEKTAPADKIIAAATSEKALSPKPGPAWAKRVCRGAYTAVCTDLVDAKATVFRGKKKLGKVELWRLEYTDATAAAAALTTMSAIRGGDEGVFGKEPQTFRRCGSVVLATRGWFRWHTVRKTPVRSLDAAHAAHYKASPKKRSRR